MRKLTLFLTLVAAPLFAASSLQSLATRSAHHLLRIERSPSGDTFAYNVVVVVPLMIAFWDQSHRVRDRLAGSGND